MEVAVLFSGGKDSSLACWYALQQGWEVSYLLTVVPRNRESWMFHSVALEWTGLQAEALGISQLRVETEGVKESELEDLKSALRRLKDKGLVGVVSGAVESDYQKTRIDNICDEAGLRSFAPLWRKNPGSLLREQIDLGYEFIVTSCMALGLGPDWLGRRVDLPAAREIEELNKKLGIHPSFEGGEAETFVLDGPGFTKRIRVTSARKVWRGDSGFLSIEEATLVSRR